jgi:uncharacterized protein YkwD
MTRLISALRRPGLRSLPLLGILGASLLGPTLASATTAVEQATISAQEARMVSLLNADRTALDLVPVRVDDRLMAIARARSADMIAKHYFSHTQPDGKTVFTILNESGITWYAAGEIIAWNNYPMDVTASTANHQWMNSAGHKAVVISTNYNYVGVGLAVDVSTGKKMWTAVYLKGPDRTGAYVTLASPTISSGSTAATRNVNLSWYGADIRLQVLTAGLHHYTIQRRVDSGDWTNVTGTTGRSLAVPSQTGHIYQFRIAAYDRAGNRGSWSTRTVDLR